MNTSHFVFLRLAGEDLLILAVGAVLLILFLNVSGAVCAALSGYIETAAAQRDRDDNIKLELARIAAKAAAHLAAENARACGAVWPGEAGGGKRSPIDMEVIDWEFLSEAQRAKYRQFITKQISEQNRLLAMGRRAVRGSPGGWPGVGSR